MNRATKLTAAALADALARTLGSRPPARPGRTAAANERKN